MNKEIYIGQKVVVNIAQENLDWGYGKDIHGKTGIVKGFAEIPYGRTQNYGHATGIYENCCWDYVEIDGKDHCISVCFLRDSENNERLISGECKRLRDLPETPFWEDDIVRITLKDFSGEVGSINHVEYLALGKYYDNGVKMPEYCINLVKGGSVHLSGNQIELIKRGNVWNYYNKLPLEFYDIESEAKFYLRIGLMEQIRNTETSLYSFSKDAAIKTLENGLGDMVVDWTPHSYSVSVWKCNDKVVGDRIRKATLVKIRGY